MIMGFGHRVYKRGDSRVPTMRKSLLDARRLEEGRDLGEIYDVLEQIMVEEKGIYPNLDFPAGPAYHLIGFDIDLFTPLFVMSRDHRLDRAHHRAERRQPPDPPAVELHRRPRARRRAAAAAGVAGAAKFRPSLPVSSPLSSASLRGGRCRCRR